MLIWFSYILVTLSFIFVAFGTVHVGGFVTLLLLLAITGCFILNILATWQIFFYPQQGFRNALKGCYLILPIFAFVLLPTYGIPFVLTLIAIYYTKTLIRKDPGKAQMLKHMESWRIKWVSVYWGIIVCFFLIAFILGSFKRTQNILPIESNSIILWK